MTHLIIGILVTVLGENISDFHFDDVLHSLIAHLSIVPPPKTGTGVCYVKQSHQ